MNKFLSNFILATIIGLVLVNCANRGTPEGGEKDLDPPVIISSSPENYSTNFEGNEIKIYFDEFIKIKDLQKQLIISPPMKTQPEITPLGSASKFITIKIYDTLQPNSTYAFNFGNSIQDNNEGNPYPYYRYVLSTGDYIDSLSVKGQITDAIQSEPDTFVSVVLYEVDSTYSDSIVYKETPKYITNTLDSLTTFSIDNVKAGKYRLLALKDENNDNKFQQKVDKIGFYEDFITVPTDSTYFIKLFNEDIDFKALRPRQFLGNKIDFPFEGNYKDMQITLNSEVPEEFISRVTKDEITDTLYFWYLPKKLEMDSLMFTVSNNKTFEKDFTVKIKDKQRDSLMVNAEPSGNIEYEDPFLLYGNLPFKDINTSKITILDKDSLKVNFDSKFDSITNTLAISFDKTEDNSYNVQVLPEAFTGFFDKVNDTLNYDLKTSSKGSFGNLRVSILNATYPIIVQLTNAKGEVKYEQYSTESKPLDFLDVRPSKYFVRVIYDSNKNEKYDTGNYLKKIQPEHISHFEIEESIRADWSYQETFTLLSK